MEKNYTKKGLITKIREHAFNTFTNGKYAKGLTKKNKRDLYNTLKELDEMHSQFQNNNDFQDVTNVEDTLNYDPNVYDASAEEESVEESDEEPVEESEEEPVEESAEDSEDFDTSIQHIEPATIVKKPSEFLKQRKQKIYQMKKKEKDLKIHQAELKEDNEYKILEDHDIPEVTQIKKQKMYSKKEASSEISFLKDQMREVISSELKPINKDIRKFNKSGFVYPFEDKKYEVIQIFEDLIKQLNDAINGILDMTDFKNEKDVIKYEEYIFSNVEKYILSIENKINKTFE